MELIAESFKIENDLEKVNGFFNEQRWGDGLPLIPPTKERVERIIRCSGDDPQETLGKMQPRLGEVTIEKIAVNAVMAGCLPEYFPVVVSAVRAMLDPKFELNLIQTTTHSRSPLVIVNGPIVTKLQINSGANAFGQGWKANATIGRAVRLIMQNIGGARPGDLDKSTQGQPGKYTFCIAENEMESPWEPLHVERGLKKENSAVTVFATEAPHNINDHVSKTAQNILSTAAGTMATLGMNSLYMNLCEIGLFLCPEHARVIANEGWTKKDVKQFIYENARQPLYKVRMGGMFDMRIWPKWFNTVDDHAMIPVVRSPEDIIVLVVGGVGRHSSCGISGPGYSVTKSVSF